MYVVWTELLVSHGRHGATQSSTATSGEKFVIVVAVAVASVCDNTYLPMEFSVALRRHDQGEQLRAKRYAAMVMALHMSFEQ